MRSHRFAGSGLMRFKFLRAGAIYGLANALSAGVPFLLLPVLTRALSPGDYGLVVSFFLLVSLSGSVAGLNVHGAVSVRWFDREKRNFSELVGAAVGLAFISSALCAFVLYFASFALQSRLGLPREFWFLAGITAGANVVLSIRTTLWQSQGRALSSASLQVIAAVLNVALSLFAVFILSLGGAGRIGGAATSVVLCSLAAVWLLKRSGDAMWVMRKADLRTLLRFGLPLIPHSVAAALLVTADRFAVGGILGREALGIYGTAAQMGMAMSILGDAMMKASSPWIFRQLAAGTARAHLRIVGLTYLMIPVWTLIAVGLWSLLEALGPLLLDPRYLAAIHLSLWFFIGGVMTSVYLNIAGLFFFTSKNEWLSIATVAAAIAAAMLAPALTLAWGLTGAAASFLLVQLIFLVLSWMLSLRVQPMPWRRPGLALRLLTRDLGAS